MEKTQIATIQEQEKGGFGIPIHFLLSRKYINIKIEKTLKGILQKLAVENKETMLHTKETNMDSEVVIEQVSEKAVNVSGMQEKATEVAVTAFKKDEEEKYVGEIRKNKDRIQTYKSVVCFDDGTEESESLNRFNRTIVPRVAGKRCWRHTTGEDMKGSMSVLFLEDRTAVSEDNADIVRREEQRITEVIARDRKSLAQFLGISDEEENRQMQERLLEALKTEKAYIKIKDYPGQDRLLEMRMEELCRDDEHTKTIQEQKDRVKEKEEIEEMLLKYKRMQKMYRDKKERKNIICKMDYLPAGHMVPIEQSLKRFCRQEMLFYMSQIDENTGKIKNEYADDFIQCYGFGSVTVELTGQKELIPVIRGMIATRDSGTQRSVLRHYHYILLEQGEMNMQQGLSKFESAKEAFVSGRRVDMETVKGWFKSLLESMKRCHRNGYIYRDWKPENIILVGEKLERAELIDYGMLIRRNEEDMRSEHVREGTSDISKLPGIKSLREDFLKIVETVQKIPGAELLLPKEEQCLWIEGTARFMARNIIANNTVPTVLDDCECLVYLIIHVLGGRLPWVAKREPNPSYVDACRRLRTAVYTWVVKNMPQCRVQFIPSEKNREEINSILDVLEEYTAMQNVVQDIKYIFRNNTKLDAITDIVSMLHKAKRAERLMQEDVYERLEKLISSLEDQKLMNPESPGDWFEVFRKHVLDHITFKTDGRYIAIDCELHGILGYPFNMPANDSNDPLENIQMSPNRQPASLSLDRASIYID